MLNKENINNHFNLPIKYLSKENIKNVSKNLIIDLELTKSSSDKKPIFDIVFQPKTELGKLNIEKFSEHFTDDKQFLKDSQKLYKKINVNLDKDKINNMINCWNTIKSNSNFKEKYQYIDYDKLDFLNHSSIFLWYSNNLSYYLFLSLSKLTFLYNF